MLLAQQHDGYILFIDNSKVVAALLLLVVPVLVAKS